MNQVSSLLCRVVFGWGLALALVAGGASAQSAEVDELQRAYKREFAFLEAEKHALQARIAESKSVQAQKVGEVQSLLETLQGKVMDVSLQADRRQQAVIEMERLAASVSEGADVIDSLTFQIDEMLDKAGHSAPAKPSDAGDGQPPVPNPSAKIQAGFDHALSTLQQAGQVRRVPGTYFSAAGQKVDGDVLKIGEIASYGLAPNALGTLSPAGAGRLKVWPEPKAVASAVALQSGNRPASLSLFLYDSLDKPVERRSESTAWEVVDSGGLIGWVIVVGGLFALLLAFVRVLMLLPNSKNADALVQELSPLVRAKHFDRALALVREQKGAVARVMTRTVQALSLPREEVDCVIDEAVMNEQPGLDRYGNAIFVIAAVAPLLGLLGTVTGMIATFDIITEFGTGNPKLLSGGISIALVTTELGLIVAIPALILGNALNGWAERIKADLDHTALRIVNLAHGATITERPASGRVSSPEMDGSVVAAT